MQIFLDDEDYKKFLFVLNDVCETYHVECWAFCLMPNHYHLVVRNQQRNLSEALRDLNSEYALWWNARHQRVGHVFQGRYKDQIVQREGYLLTLLRYVAMNPVRARLADAPDAWPWSSYGCTAGLRHHPEFVFVDDVLRQFGDADPATLRERYVRHVLSQPRPGEMDEDRFRSRELVLGDRSFKRSVLGEPDAVHDVVHLPPGTPVAIGA